VQAMQPDTGRHIDDDEMERYSMGDAPQDRAALIEEHLLICEGCRQRAAESDAYVAAMRQAAAELRRQQGKLKPDAAKEPRGKK